VTPITISGTWYCKNCLSWITFDNYDADNSFAGT